MISDSLKMDNYLSSVPIEMIEIIIAYLDDKSMDILIKSCIIDIDKLNWNRVYKNRYGHFSTESADKDRYILCLNTEIIISILSTWKPYDSEDIYDINL